MWWYQFSCHFLCFSHQTDSGCRFNKMKITRSYRKLESKADVEFDVTSCLRVSKWPLIWFYIDITLWVCSQTISTNDDVAGMCYWSRPKRTFKSYPNLHKSHHNLKILKITLTSTSSLCSALAFSVCEHTCFISDRFNFSTIISTIHFYLLTDRIIQSAEWLFHMLFAVCLDRS